MGYIEGHSRDQMLLLPASVDDYVAADNPARLIAAFVDDLDLGELGFDRGARQEDLESGPNAPPLVAQQYRPTAGSMNDG